VIIATAAFSPVSTSLDRSAPPRWRDKGAARLAQWLILAAATAGFVSPLAAVIADGLRGLDDMLTRPAFWSATLTSLAVATASALLTLVLGLILAASRAATNASLVRLLLGLPAYAYLAVPAVALALGAFLFVRGLGLSPDLVAPAVVIVANALLALPFVMATLAPPFDVIARTRGKLIRSLDLSGPRQFTAVEWPLLARDIGLVLALSFCFSLGDLGVIALFDTRDFVTLPLLMVRALGAYRTNDAGSIAALMLVLTIVVFIALPALFERLSRARA
jgi:thiamine transport system permease protein